MTGRRDRFRGVTVLVSVAATLAMTACDSTTTPSPTADVTGAWRLTSIERPDGALLRPTGAADYSVRFAADGALSVTADCNVCRGSYSAEPETLSVGTLACTLAACGPASLERSFVSALSGARSWTLEGDELAVGGEAGTLRFRADER